MSLAQSLIARGEARGVWIGKIQLLEQMTGIEVTTTAVLDTLSLEQLEERFAALEQSYAAKFKQR